ncbi:MAG: efflux RND transporter periplasmic adaptor subunit [Gracilimonas sp.]|uniref:Efflux RND transporter periplasmic adaptor subunit n=1 Tax=Gracilimonas sediminicola TaxID=2952158 RepID=A0A9X2L3J1_9BACT|nr:MULTISPECIES: efflux RND transporter periplasmic adaptor subunit [Gracilimonas]MBO6585133.1 efflux RND transporter periplasmic adaptor subunit [Gracilimonas sp.]MBO6615595.1 efflux RND transporter periplasmic adaptor subunit [Gracilimonas sp.]MCP9291575.1 efflux RND transporter periplasmic adaptor subunit [Gracilimonas sediminicola]
MKKKYLIPGIIIGLSMIAWFVFGGESSETVELTTTPKKGEFVVDVTTTGELRAKQSVEIKGPQGVREIRLFNMKIQRLIPEGTIVKEGDFVAELDRSEITGRLQDAMLELQQAQSQVTQVSLDSTLTLSQARDNLINLEYALEERQIAVDQSKYESPAVQRQAEIDLDKARRQLAQEKKNYITKVKQAEAQMSEVEADLQEEQNEVNKIRSLLQQFTVKAPAQGMVIYKRNYDGSKVTEGSDISAWNPTVAELPDFSVMESITYVNEVDVQKIAKDQNVEIGLDAIPDKNLYGTVTSVANIGEQRPNSDSKVYEVIIEIAETDSVLRPAMTTSNRVIVNRVPDAMYIPLETIHVQDSTSFVFKKDGLSPVMQEVELGLMNENEVIVHRGLSIDDVIYLSVPQDTAGIERLYLEEEITSN